MNRLKAKRWLNEYLDGEIGLADKAEFERMMAQEPELRQEYEELRRIGLLMSSGPEVEVNPVSFRARLRERIEPQQRYAFTPQRAFAGSMLVALLVVGLTFGQYIYSRVMEGEGRTVVQSSTSLASSSSIQIRCSAAEFLNAALLRAENGSSMDSARLVDQLDSQAGLFDGAVCTESASGHVFSFPGGLPGELNLRVDAGTLREISAIAAELDHYSQIPMVQLNNGSSESISHFALSNPRGKIDLNLSFSR